MHVADFDGKKPRIGHFEANQLDQLLSHGFGYPEDSTFVHCQLSAISYQRSARSGQLILMKADS